MSKIMTELMRCLEQDDEFREQYDAIVEGLEAPHQALTLPMLKTRPSNPSVTIHSKKEQSHVKKFSH